MSVPHDVHSAIQTAQVGLFWAAARQFAEQRPAEASGMANLFAGGEAAVLVTIVIGADCTRTCAQMVTPAGLVPVADLFDHASATIYPEDIRQAHATRN